MATRRHRSWWNRIGRNVVHAAAIFLSGGGGQANLLVARQLAERRPDRDIYDPAPRVLSRRRLGRRRRSAPNAELPADH